MAISKFQKRRIGTSPTYKCRVCDHMTRETGEGESEIQLCAFCYLVSGDSNRHSDTDGDVAEHIGNVKLWIRQYKPSIQRIEAALEYITLEDLGLSK